MADFTMSIRPGSWFWGLDNGTPVLVDSFKTNHYFAAVQYLADRDTHNRLSGEEPRWTGVYLPLFAECWGLNSVTGSLLWISNATEADTTNSPLTLSKQISTNTSRYAVLMTPRNTSFWNVNTPKLRRDVT